MLLRCHIVAKLYNWSKICGSIQVHILERVLVSFDDAVQTVYLRVKDVTVQSKAVRGSIVGWWDYGAKAENRDLLVRVIILEDVTDGLDGVQILILVHVKVMEGVSLCWITITESEINGHG